MKLKAAFPHHYHYYLGCVPFGEGEKMTQEVSVDEAKNPSVPSEGLQKTPESDAAPPRLWVQIAVGGGTISYNRDPREFHDNGKPVYEYALTDRLVFLQTEVERLRTVLHEYRAQHDWLWRQSTVGSDENCPCGRCIHARAVLAKTTTTK